MPRTLAVAAVLALTFAIATRPAQAADKVAAKPSEAAPAEDPAKFFLFHAGEQSADQFRGDLVYCIEHAYPILSMRDRMPSQGGLIGAMINGRMAEIDRLRMQNAAMRKCMGLMGYARFLVPEAQWNDLVKRGDMIKDNDGLVDPEVVERMVAFAIAPAPVTGRLEP